MSLWDVGNTTTPDYERWLGQEWKRELDEYILEKYGTLRFAEKSNELDRQEPEAL